MPDDILFRLTCLIEVHNIGENYITRRVSKNTIEIRYKTHYITSIQDVITLLEVLKEFDINLNVSYFSASLINLKFKE
jgi:hypothetical protein